METTIERKPTSFRLRKDLLEEMKRHAARENRTLNNYVESLLLDLLYPDKAAKEEAPSLSCSGNSRPS